MRMVAAWLPGNFFFFFFVFLFPSLRIWTPFFFYYQLRCKCDCLYERFGNVVGFFSSVNGSFKQAFTLIFDFGFSARDTQLSITSTYAFFFFCLPFLKKMLLISFGCSKGQRLRKRNESNGLRD